MKIRVLLLFFLPMHVFAQSPFTSDLVGLSGTRTTVGAMQWADLDCGRSSRDGNGYRIGVQYQKLLRPKFALESGLYLAQAEYQLISSSIGPEGIPVTVVPEDRTYRMLSLLIRPKYYVNTHRVRFYLVGGVSIDAQVYDSVNEDSNSGIGAQVGAGLEGTLGKRFAVSLEPTIRALSLVRFESEQYPWRVITAGFQLSAYYAL